MALANFFDKVNLSASQLLKEYDRSAFEEKLLSQRIAVTISKNTLETHEGKVTIDLLVRLLSRLYPNIMFIPDEDSNTMTEYIETLKSLAKKINPDINCNEKEKPTISIIIGENNFIPASPAVFYIGSENWTGKFSVQTQQSISDSKNPFGAGIAACLACANLFRYIFSEELGGASLDQTVQLSAYSQQINTTESEPVLPDTIDVNFTLVGTGAIGNAALWSLLNLTDLHGKISLIDKDNVSLSNLQRYVLMFQEHIQKVKVEVIKDLFDSNSAVDILQYNNSWQNIISQLTLDQMSLVAAALDTKKDRLLLQSSLPKIILNAWTSPDCIGVSRHTDFLNDICLSCLYIPEGKTDSISQSVAAAMNMTAHEQFFRYYLANKLPIDANFLEYVCMYGGHKKDKLKPFENQSVEYLYSEGICGGRIISVADKEKVNHDMEVPLAHESALAGILLAAEIVIELNQIRTDKLPALTKINLLRPLHAYLLEEEGKHYSGLCLCQDYIFKSRYKEKWSSA